jgi:L-aminopeptidase/D-esterase-like protein
MRNLITDVPGVTVGGAEDDAARTGVTVLLCGHPFTAAVDVRGGGPGTRETEALSPENLVGAADAIVLSGGSAYGLAAADAVTAALGARGRGFSARPGNPTVPIVPAAILYDLGPHSHAWRDAPPFAALGAEALAAAGPEFSLGAHGAGRGATAGLLKGGLGSVSAGIGGGLIVGALVAVNPVGSVCTPVDACFWTWPFEVAEEFGGRRPSTGAPPAQEPIPEDSKLFARIPAPGTNTTIAVVATNAALSTAECKRVAMMAQDGFARAIRPAHTPFDGDTVFALASGALEVGAGPERALEVARIGASAADCVARAVARGVHEARSAEGEAPAWRDRAGG